MGQQVRHVSWLLHRLLRDLTINNSPEVKALLNNGWYLVVQNSQNNLEYYLESQIVGVNDVMWGIFINLNMGGSFYKLL
jgi:hypothetical protein